MHEARQTIGKYLVERELGRGGMGVVYRGLDPQIERAVAIKTVSKSLFEPAQASDMMARFKREAQAAGRLTHPNIVAVYEYGEESDIAFIAMELVDGQGLDVLAQDGAPMPVEQVRPIAAQLLDALQFAHGLGVVHRDIKPSNLIMTASGRLKVCDFGIAQLETSKLTQVGTVLGTPSYMSPEQIQGLRTDARSDVFSAAVVLYQLLTGSRPFGGTELAALVYALVNSRPQPPSILNPALDTTLDAVLLQALATLPEERFTDAGQFAMALEYAFQGQPWRVVDHTLGIGISNPPALPNLRKFNFSAVQKKIAVPSLQPQTTTDDQLGKLRVLFVDDEERILSALKLLFRQSYEVHVASGGAEALELLKQHHFHVLVSDQRMPNMTGTELLSKALLASPNTVRILLTGYSDLAAIVGSVNEGEIYRFASKPWDTQELRSLLAEAAVIGQALEHSPPVTSGASRPNEAVLILDEDREIYLAARDLLGRSFTVLHASTLQAALQTLGESRVAVLVADIEGSRGGHRTFFKLLKQEHPEIVTIAMSSASDSELVIELINQARIFRFLNKPIKLAVLQAQVEAAMAHFLKQQAQPVRLREQQTQRKAQEAAPSEGSVGSLILNSLRSLRRRWSGS